MIMSAKLLAVNPRDPPTYQQYSGHSHSVSESIKRLVTAIRDSAPGQRECDSSLKQISAALHELDQASLAAVSQRLDQRTEKSAQGWQDQVMGVSRQMLDLLPQLQDAAKREAEKLGHTVTAMAGYTGPLAHGSVGLASRTQQSQRQTTLLDQAKTVAESVLQLTLSAKECGGL